jgi:hypothetical protein
MVRLVTPMGTTSKTHHVAASKKTARAPLPSGESAKAFPSGIEGGRPGRRIVNDDEQNDANGHKQIFIPAKPDCRGCCRVATHLYSPLLQT